MEIKGGGAGGAEEQGKQWSRRNTATSIIGTRSVFVCACQKQLVMRKLSLDVLLIKEPSCPNSTFMPNTSMRQ